MPAPNTRTHPLAPQVPFGSFEEALKKRDNKSLASELAAAVKAVKQGEGSGKQLARCRELVMKVG